MNVLLILRNRFEASSLVLEGIVAKILAFMNILTGDDKSYSLSQKHYPSSRHRSQPPTPRSAQSPRARLESQPLSEPVTVPKANINEARGRWFSCIPCCSFCS
ncbi:hypothetical protein POTOM_050392 [Populus tomentosa]|uniref:Uncharacterized protein n=1 Tax=Populus tomentosa TaxID=118781 RepID=A0A8X8C9E3_POPTO|nr:hypothetical protein POTOM_050392 [Populus tomentosa]